MINIAQETLGLRRTDFSSVLSLLIPAYSLPSGPAVLAVGLHSPWNAPLPFSNRLQSDLGFRRIRRSHPTGESIASVLCLSPVKFAAQDCLTSELLRTL